MDRLAGAMHFTHPAPTLQSVNAIIKANTFSVIALLIAYFEFYNKQYIELMLKLGYTDNNRQKKRKN